MDGSHELTATLTLDVDEEQVRALVREEIELAKERATDRIAAKGEVK